MRRDLELLRESRRIAKREADAIDSKDGLIVGANVDGYLVVRNGTSRPVPASYAGIAKVGQYCELKFVHPNRYVITSVYDRPGPYASPSLITPQGFALAPPSNFRALPGVGAGVIFGWDVPIEQVVSFEVFTASGVDVTGVTGVEPYVTTRGAFAVIDSEDPIYARVRSVALGGERSSYSPWVQASPGTAGAGTIEVTDGTTTVAEATAVEFTSGATVTDAGGGLAQIAVAGGSGDVTGPGSSTDNALVRWDGVGGDTIQNSSITVNDSNEINFGGGTGFNLKDKIVAANSGTSYAVDMAAAGVYEITLDDDPTLTLSNVAAGRSVMLKLIQDGTGGRVVTWGTTITWFDSEPVLLTGVGAVDIIILTVRSDGSTIDGLASTVFPEEWAALTRMTNTVLYKGTLASAGRFDIANANLRGGVGNYADYDFIEIIAELRSDVAAANDLLYLYFNADTTVTNYDAALHYAGSGTASARYDAPNAGYMTGATVTPTFKTIFRILIPSPGSGDYKQASIVSAFYDNNNYNSQYAIWWHNAAAITQITLQPDGYSTQNLTAGSKITIIGYREEEIGGGSENTRQAVFFFGSTVETGRHPMRIYNEYGSDRQIERVTLWAGTGPVGASILVDVNLGGTTIFTDQAHRPAIASAAQAGSSNLIDVSTWVDGQYLEVDVDQVGSTTPGVNLTVSVVFGGAS